MLRQQLRTSAHGPDKGYKLASVGTDACPPPLARHNGSQGQTGGFSALRETAVLFVNGVVIPVFSKSAFLLSVLRHPGRLKWVRASARNCGWRIAGRDACPTRGWVKLFLRPVAADGRRWQSALQGGGCWFIQLYFLPVRFILNFEEGLVSRTVSHLRSTLPPWGAEWLRRAPHRPPRPIRPTQQLTGANKEIFPALRPSGRPKWVREPARNKRLAALVASQTLCLPHLRVGKLPSPTCCQRRPGDATLRRGDTSCCACFFPSPVVH